MKTDKNKHIFAIIGGDRRQAVIGKKLAERGHDVRVFALGDFFGGRLCSSAEKAIEGCEIILLPLPVTRDNINVAFSANLVFEKIKLTDIVHLAIKHGCKAILGGMMPRELLRIGDDKGIFVSDYYASEGLQIKNALPSAEGALMIAMEHTEKTVSGMKALVSGYGRIGKLLVGMLDRLGAKVTVAVRRDDVKREIELLGYDTVKLGGENRELCEKADGFDVIFNTVPHIIFTDKVISQINNKPLYIEIASSPGGIDLSAARRAEIQTIFAPSLPGKYAPVSAGEYVFETISEILAERSIYI